MVDTFTARLSTLTYIKSSSNTETMFVEDLSISCKTWKNLNSAIYQKRCPNNVKKKLFEDWIRIL